MKERLEGKEVDPKLLEIKDSKITRPKQSTQSFDIKKFMNKEPLSKLDNNKMQEMVKGGEVDHKLLETKYSKIPRPVIMPGDKIINIKPPLQKLDKDEMHKMLNKNTKEYFINESQKAYTAINYLNKKIKEDPNMSSRKIKINNLKELYNLRATYFSNKYKNDLEKIKP